MGNSEDATKRQKQSSVWLCLYLFLLRDDAAETEVAALNRRIQLLEEDQERIRKALEKFTNMKDDRISLLETQLGQARLIAEESDKKYEEMARQIAMLEADLERAEERASIGESKIVELEEELRVVVNNMKSLEVSEEKAMQNEETYEITNRQLSQRFQELVWINPSNPAEHKIVFEDTMDTNNSDEGKTLLKSALKGPLGSQQQEDLLKITTDSKLVNRDVLEPDDFMQLVEDNYKIAVEIVLKLRTSKQINKYIELLISKPLTLNTMSTMAELISALKFPRKSFKKYIEHCINHCKVAQDVKLIKLMCRFFKHLLIYDVDIRDHEIVTLMQSFALDNYLLKDAEEVVTYLKEHL